MTASEHHPQLAVFDFRIDEQLVETLLSVGPLPGPFFPDSLTNLISPQGVENLVLGDAMDPAGRIIRNLHAPGLERIQERRLHHIFDELEVPPTEDAREHRYQSARLMAEEMLHKRSNGFSLVWG